MVSYKQLWKLLIDKDMHKTDLRKTTGILIGTMSKLVKGEDVTVSTLAGICNALDGDISDILEYQKEKPIKMKR